MATTTTSTNFYHSGMTGAPQLGTAASNMLAVLRMALTQNSLSQTVSIVIASGVGTVTCPTSNPFSVGMNVKLAHGTYTPLNTTRRITQVTGLTYKIDCSDMTAGTYTNVTQTTASLGWSEVYTSGSTSVFKSNAATGSNCYLRVVDAAGSDTLIQVFEEVVDYTRVTARKFTVNTYLTPLYWPKAGEAGFNSPWTIIGDAATFYIGICPFYNRADTFGAGRKVWFGFGQFTSMLSSDSYNNFVSGSLVSCYQNDYPYRAECSLNFFSASLQPIYLQRHQSGIKRGEKARIVQDCIDFCNVPGVAGMGDRRGLMWDTFSANASGLLYSDLYLRTQKCLRGRLRGLLVPCHDTGLYSTMFAHGATQSITHNGATRNYMVDRDTLCPIMFDYDGSW